MSKMNTNNEKPKENLAPADAAPGVTDTKTERTPGDIAQSTLKRLAESRMPLPEAIAMLQRAADQLKAKSDQVLASPTATPDEKRAALLAEDQVLTPLLRMEHVDQRTAA
jgi:hypothetical protein